MTYASLFLGLVAIVSLVTNIIFIAIFSKKPDGTFRVNLSDPQKDVLTVELDKPLGSITTSKKMIFKVVVEGRE